MKRPLVVITAGFVLGEVLALCLQEAVYRKCFWFAGALFLAALIARHFLEKTRTGIWEETRTGIWLEIQAGVSHTGYFCLFLCLFLVEWQQEVF